jgi:phage repressor protein C with HTH and peptisase S24 domain
LREFTDAPLNMLKFARVRGTSMKPTIDHGAIVMLDLRRNRIDEQDEIWAVAVADIGMVKRIWANADGSYKIKSDNPAVGPETAVDGEMYVIGRVVGGLSKY